MSAPAITRRRREPVSTAPGGTRYAFTNGYGALVASEPDRPGFRAVAVLDRTGRIVTDTLVTRSAEDGILRNLTRDHIGYVLDEIEALPARTG
jgi:hypothetical protein